MTQRNGYKLLPVIDQDYCTGCARCVEACDHCCLEMVWDFATLTVPDHCGSEGYCMSACPTNVIHMDWVKMEGNARVGQWRSEPEREQKPCSSWIGSLFGQA